ncbi:uncharacterized protein LOC128726984 [Anopheles nili]|uniref:uncharacterized protein LOC128726984 n=1 Tax=Anopheles nili TaxID=185578 RepID=UPI00237A969A|nr:uncharacterized protein LOC128726984 [Anopheles nili]
MTVHRSLLLLLAIAAGCAQAIAAMYECSTPDIPPITATCLLRNVRLASSVEVDSFFLRDDIRHVALQMVNGSIPDFSRTLGQKLPNVQDLTVDGMGVQRLFIWPELELLSARKNAIRVVDFASAAHRLRSLQLDDNELSSVPPFGSRFNELQYLSLDGNRLEQVALDAFSKLAQLQSLSIARNRLFSVVLTENVLPPVVQNIKFLKLKTLSFADNRLLTLNISGWELPSLASLNLARNNLYLLFDTPQQLSQFTTLQQLSYAGNDWNCEWLSDAQFALGSLTFRADHDQSGRCEQERMRTLRGICCYEPAEQNLTHDPFETRWEQLAGLWRRYELVQFAFDQVQDADLNLITERAHELRGRLVGSVAQEQDVITSAIVNMRNAVANESAQLERLEATIVRSVEDLQLTIQELHERAVRPKPTLDAVQQLTIVSSIEHVRGSVLSLHQKVQAYVLELGKREARMRTITSRISQLEQQLVDTQLMIHTLHELVDIAEDEVKEAYYLIEQDVLRQHPNVQFDPETLEAYRIKSLFPYRP